MAIENNIIKSPVHLAANVARLLQTNKMTTAALCTHPNINMWSKRKPIDYPKVTPLTVDEFRGNKSGSGIIYGIRVGMDAGRWDTLDDATYEYVDRPKGGQSSPYRLSDFLGYYHDARPDLTGNVPAICYYNTQNGIEAQINFSTVNRDTCISINDLAPSSLGETAALKFYLCIKIDNKVHALKNTHYNDYTPIEYQDAQWQQFNIEIPDDLRTTGDKTVTVFLAQQIQNGLLFDIQTKWLDVSGQLSNTPSVLVIPNCGGLTVNFRELIQAIIKVVVTKPDTSTYRFVFNGSSGVDYVQTVEKSPHARITYNGITVDKAISSRMFQNTSPDLGSIGAFMTYHYVDVKASEFNQTQISGRVTVQLKMTDRDEWAQTTITI